MERVNDARCEQWHELIAAHVLGDLGMEETSGLHAHLEGCVACRATLEEMTETVAWLGLVNHDAIESSAMVPPQLFDAVLGELHHAGLTQRRRRTVRTALFAGVFAAAASFVLVSVIGANPSTPSERVVALHGASTVHASAVLLRESWGTTLNLNERGLPGGQVYTVSMETSSGRWWTAGTYRSVAGKSVSATMACAVSSSTISGVRVVNASGVTVLSSFAQPGSSYH